MTREVERAARAAAAAGSPFADEAVQWASATFDSVDGDGPDAVLRGPSGDLPAAVLGKLCDDCATMQGHVYSWAKCLYPTADGDQGASWLGPPVVPGAGDTGVPTVSLAAAGDELMEARARDAADEAPTERTPAMDRIDALVDFDKACGLVHFEPDRLAREDSELAVPRGRGPTYTGYGPMCNRWLFPSPDEMRRPFGDRAFACAAGARLAHADTAQPDAEDDLAAALADEADSAVIDSAASASHARAARPHAPRMDAMGVWRRGLDLWRSLQEAIDFPRENGNMTGPWHAACDEVAERAVAGGDGIPACASRRMAALVSDFSCGARVPSAGDEPKSPMERARAQCAARLHIASQWRIAAARAKATAMPTAAPGPGFRDRLETLRKGAPKPR